MRSIAAAVCFWVSGFMGGAIFASVVHGNTRLVPLFTISASILCGSGLLMQFGAPRRRYARLALVMLVLVVAQGAEGATILLRGFSSPIGTPIAINPGEDLVFRITADSGPTFDWSYEIPSLPNPCCGPATVLTFTEANAGSVGLDWAALETAMTGNRGQGTQWGPSGSEESVDYLNVSEGYLSTVDLTEVRLTLSPMSPSPGRWVGASIRVSGTFTGLAPEPSSFVLSLGMVHAMACSRRRGVTSCRS